MERPVLQQIDNSGSALQVTGFIQSCSFSLKAVRIAFLASHPSAISKSVDSFWRDFPDSHLMQYFCTAHTFLYLHFVAWPCSSTECFIKDICTTFAGKKDITQPNSCFWDIPWTLHYSPLFYLLSYDSRITNSQDWIFSVTDNPSPPPQGHLSSHLLSIKQKDPQMTSIQEK